MLSASILKSIFEFRIWIPNLSKTFVGEVITNTEANRKPPFLKTDIIKSEIIADPNAADSGAAKSKKKKKSSKINSEDMKVQFADETINSDADDETEKMEKAKDFRKFCAKRYFSLNLFF